MNMDSDSDSTDLRRFREHSSGLVFRVEYQARSPNGPIGLMAVLDPSTKRDVNATILAREFAVCDLSSIHAATCEKCGGERIRVGGAYGMHCLWCADQARAKNPIYVGEGDCMDLNIEELGRVVVVSKDDPALAPMILPPPPSQPVPAPVVPVVASEPSPALGIDCALFRNDPDRWHLLRSRARWLSARYYGAPVFLVGSAVTSSTPRDIDVVIVLPADLFVLVYGSGSDTLRDFRSGADRDDPPMIWRRWARDCAKQGEAWTREVNRAVDFKVLPDNDAVTISDKPRVLLAHVGADRL